MIHTSPTDGAYVESFHGEALEGKMGSIRAIEDNGRGYIMILLPFPKEIASGLIDSLIHGY